MNIRNNWLRYLCLSVLTISAFALPLTASAQHKKKHHAKTHKVIQARKTHKRHVHHVKRPHRAVQVVPQAPPIKAEQVTPSVQENPSGPVAGTPYDEATWRGFHPDWNGQYHFNGGKYYYDEASKYPAQVPSEFSSIASRFGGVATLDNDPTLIFTGDSGEPYPIAEYNSDRSMHDKKLKLKSAYFGRPYFWRDGERFDRKIVIDDKGARCFQFVKHP